MSGKFKVESSGAGDEEFGWAAGDWELGAGLCMVVDDIRVYLDAKGWEFGFGFAGLGIEGGVWDCY
jgi:hypothetical protein